MYAMIGLYQIDIWSSMDTILTHYGTFTGINTLWPKQNICNFAGNIFICIFIDKKLYFEAWTKWLLFGTQHLHV